MARPWRQVGGNYSARIGQNGFTDGPSTRTDVTPAGSFGLVSSFGAVRAIPARRSRIATSTSWTAGSRTGDLEEFDRWVATPGCVTGFGDALLDPDGPLDLAIVTDHNATEDPTLAETRVPPVLRLLARTSAAADLGRRVDAARRRARPPAVARSGESAQGGARRRGLAARRRQRFVGGAELRRHRRCGHASSSRRSPPRASPPRSMGCSTTRPRPTSGRSRNGRTCR